MSGLSPCLLKFSSAALLHSPLPHDVFQQRTALGLGERIPQGVQHHWKVLVVAVLAVSKGEIDEAWRVLCQSHDQFVGHSRRPQGQFSDSAQTRATYPRFRRPGAIRGGRLHQLHGAK